MTIILPPGNTAAPTADIVVAGGEVVTVGIYSATDSVLGTAAQFIVEQVTPGVPNKLGALTDTARSMQLAGPCTYRVRRTAYTGVPFGVFRSDV